MATTEKIEVFQDLFLHGLSTNRKALRTALINAASVEWRHNLEREERIRASIETGTDVMVFERDANDLVDAVELALWSYENGYKVGNVVPREVGQLDETRYNVALRDFAEKVARPAATKGEFEVEVSPPQQGLEDWISSDAANALRSFFNAAITYTGSNHPADQGRWIKFIIEDHRNRKSLDAEILARWLIEIERWPEDTAHELASEYQFSSELLDAYDKE